MSPAERLAELADAMDAHADLGEPLMPLDIRSIVEAIEVEVRRLRAAQRDREKPCRRLRIAA